MQHKNVLIGFISVCHVYCLASLLAADMNFTPIDSIVTGAGNYLDMLNSWQEHNH